MTADEMIALALELDSLRKMKKDQDDVTRRWAEEKLQLSEHVQTLEARLKDREADLAKLGSPIFKTLMFRFAGQEENELRRRRSGQQNFYKSLPPSTYSEALILFGEAVKNPCSSRFLDLAAVFVRLAEEGGE